jgi:TRAP-type C4-dicarboxylate transport system substrate-binding protein
MNLDTFKSFPPEIQNILVETGKETVIRAAKEIIPKWWDRCVKEWKAKGIIFLDLPDAEKIKWAATLEDIPAEWAKEMEEKGLPGFKIVERWQQITSEMGYKWPRKWGMKK